MFKTWNMYEFKNCMEKLGVKYNYGRYFTANDCFIGNWTREIY